MKNSSGSDRNPARVNLHHDLFRAGQIKQIEQIAIDSNVVSGFELMQRAGKAAWEFLLETWPQARRIVVVCGAGNNAGDGYILAAHGIAAGKHIDLLTLGNPDNLKGDALIAAGLYQADGGKISAYNPEDLQHADVIVDAIFGTGIDRNVEGAHLDAIRAINASGKPVLAVDIPSGLHADTGMPMGAAISASRTISFVGRKQGMYTGEGAEFCGCISCAALQIPAAIYRSIQPAAQLLVAESLDSLLPRRARTAHKSDYGHVLVIGGDYGFAGAVRMSAEAAARSGAGLVSIATRVEHALAIPVARPELMASAVRSSNELLPLLDRATVVVIGPGLGQSDWSRSLFSRVLDSKLPLIVDADALNLLAQDPTRRENWILTPHPGEAARLLSSTVSAIQSDRYAASLALHEQYGGIVVLKGSGTIITADHAPQFVCDSGNPGMATGGMGDVLSGIISGLLAQGLNQLDASTLGVSVHARAADRAAAEHGERGLLATDLFQWIRKLVNP